MIRMASYDCGSSALTYAKVMKGLEYGTSGKELISPQRFYLLCPKSTLRNLYQEYAITRLYRPDFDGKPGLYLKSPQGVVEFRYHAFVHSSESLLVTDEGRTVCHFFNIESVL